MSIKYETIKSETIHTENADLTTTFTAERDPFDEPLEDNLIMNDTLFAEARNSVTVDGMEYSFLKPPYMNFDDQFRTKRKLREAYTQHEFLLLYGYSGCGKTTVLTQFHERFPDYIHLITDFTSLSPANLIVKMGEFIGLPLKLRSSEIFTLQDRLRSIMIWTKGYHSPVILITEHVTVITKDSITLFGQQPANFEDFTAVIRSRLLYTELSSIGASGYDLIGYIVGIEEKFSIFVVIKQG